MNDFLSHFSSFSVSPHWKRIKSNTRARWPLRNCATVLLGSPRNVWGRRRVSLSPQGRSSMLPKDWGASPTTCRPSLRPRTSSSPSFPPSNITRAPYRPIASSAWVPTPPWTYEPMCHSAGTPTVTALFNDMFSPSRPEGKKKKKFGSIFSNANIKYFIIFTFFANNNLHIRKPEYWHICKTSTTVRTVNF